MPRAKSPPRLWLDQTRQAWTVIDGGKRIRTGCGADQVQAASDFLADYIAANHTIAPGKDPLIEDVLLLYSDEHLAYTASAASVSYDLEQLEKWWGGKTVSQITAANCRAYIEHRQAPTICRRELGFLNAAVMFWHKHRDHGPIGTMPVIVKPPASDPRTRWMTREEAAAIVERRRPGLGTRARGGHQ